MLLSQVLGGFRRCVRVLVCVCVCVCGSEAGGHQRLHRVVWIKERKVDQTLVGGPFLW